MTRNTHKKYRKNLLILGSILAIFLASFSGGMAEEERGDEGERVREFLDEVENSAEGNLWDVAGQIELIGSASGSEAATLDELQKQASQRTGYARVVVGYLLVQLGDNDNGTQTLLDTIESDETEGARTLAAELIGLSRKSTARGRLTDLVEGETLPGPVQIVSARTLWIISRDDENTQRVAGSALKKFLKDRDPVHPELRYTAAISLAEMNAYSKEVRIALNEMKSKPGELGRLAKSLLDRDALSQKYDHLSKAAKEDKFLEEIMSRIQSKYVTEEGITREDLLTAAARGMVQSLDAFSYYMSPEEKKDLDEGISGEYSGIGAYVERINGRFVVSSPIFGGPADGAGIQSMDQIVSVDGEEIGMLNSQKDFRDVIKLLKGPSGTKVRLGILRYGWDEPEEFLIERAKIKVESVRYEMLPGKVGYLRLTTFGTKSGREMDAALNDLEKNGMEALVFDLRNNPGGLLSAAQKIAATFLKRGDLIVYSEGRTEPRHDYLAENRKVRPDYPIVLLINSGSASASEIVTGALKHYKRVIVIGETTFGKGSVQKLYDLRTRPGSELRLTTSHYFLPDGTWIHGVGIPPQIEAFPVTISLEQSNLLRDFRNSGALEEYLDAHFDDNQDLFLELAVNDGKDTSRYPDFDKWYESLEMEIEKDDARRLLRNRLRDKAREILRKEFFTDIEVDTVLQKGITVLLHQLKWKADTVEKFEFFAADLYQEMGEQLEALQAAEEDKEEATR